MDVSNELDGGRSNEPVRSEVFRHDSSFSTPFGEVDPIAIMKKAGDEMERVMRRIGVSDWLERIDAPGFFPNLRADIFGRNFPQIEIVERGGNLVVRVDLPGINREDISVDVDDTAITVRGQRREQADENRPGYYHSERRYGSFERRIELPEGADVENAKAEFRDGVLEITMPAPQPKSNTRRIEIG